MPLLYGIRHAWPEQAGFCLNRRNGYPGYSFVHFLTSVEIVIDAVYYTHLTLPTSDLV